MPGNYGLRPDGTKKGTGFLGALKTKDGHDMTEFSIGVEMDGKEVLIPTLVPTLTQDEINSLLSGNDVTPDIVNKAYDHALMRMRSGKSPFASATESPMSGVPAFRGR